VPSASDEELLARQSALQEEAGEVLAGLGLAALVADIGPLLVTGSFVSGLMCWPGTARADHRRTTPGCPEDQRRLAPPSVLYARGRGLEIYTAILDDEVRTPQQFAAWLTHHDLPAT
jgi:hypothetical protein